MPLLSDADIGMAPEAAPKKRLLTDEEIMGGTDYGSMPWSEVLSRAKTNFMPKPGEAEALKERVGYFPSPTVVSDTVIGIGKAALGGAEMALGYGPESQISNEQEVAGDLWDHYKKYGSVAGIKELIAEKPGDVAVDALSLGVGPKVLRGSPKPAAAPVPKIATSAELKTAGGAGLNVVRDSGVYFTEDFIKPFSETLNTTAHNLGYRPGRAGTKELGAIMKDVEAMNNRPQSFREIHELDQDLNDIIVKQPGTTNANIAHQMKRAIDQFMKQVEDGAGQGIVAHGDITPAQAANIYKNSLSSYHHGKKADRVAALLKKADVDSWLYTQSGIAPQIKKHFRQVYKNDKKMVGYTPEERAMIEDIATGTLTDKALLLGSKLAIRGPVSFGMNAIFGSTFGGPMANAAMAGIGEVTKRAFDKRTRGKAERLKTHILEKGSENLRNLLGDAVHDQLEASPRGRGALTSWVKNRGRGATSRSLALIVAQEVNRPDLAPRIQAELDRLSEQGDQ
jgi:hypothetical protein